MQMFNQIGDNRGQSGVGAGLYYIDKKDTEPTTKGKYRLAFPLETVPVISPSINSIDVDITTDTVVSKIPGKSTIDNKDAVMLAHRDNLKRLQRMKSQGDISFMAVYGDFIGVRFTGTINYKGEDITSGDKATFTATIVPSSVDEIGATNVYDLLAPSCKFATPIDAVVNLETKTGKYTIPVATMPADAVVTVVSQTPTVATATYTDNAIIITGIAEGSTEVIVTAKKEKYAEWETSILVIVPQSV